MVQAQGRGGGEWTTSHGDAQRASWVRTDARLTKDAVQKGELKFLWKMKLDNETRQLNSLTTPVLMDRLISHRGFKALAFVGASGERVYAIDTDLARVYWTTIINYSSITPPANSSWACPGGLMAAATRPTTVCRVGVRRGQGRRARWRIGKLRRRAGQGRAEPGAGRPRLGRGVARRRTTRLPLVEARHPRLRVRRARLRPVAVAAAGSVAGRPTTSSSWRATATRARSIRTTGPTACRPVPFLPANARPSDLIAVDGVLYTSTSNGCGAAPNGVWAHRPGQRRRRSRCRGRPTAGTSPERRDSTFGTDGTIFVAVGASASGAAAAPGAAAYSNAIVALEPKTLKLKDSFTQPGADFNTSPVVFRHKDKDLMAVSGNDGRLYLLDGTSLKTPLHVTPKYSNAGATGGLATWESDGTRWILAPAVGARAARHQGRRQRPGH